MSNKDEEEDISERIETIAEWLQSNIEVVENVDSTVQGTVAHSATPLSPVSDAELPGTSHDPAMNLAPEAYIALDERIYAAGQAFRREQAPPDKCDKCPGTTACAQCPGTTFCSSTIERLFRSPEITTEVTKEMPLTDSQKLLVRDEFPQRNVIYPKNVAVVKPRLVCRRCPDREFSNRTELMLHGKWFHPAETPASRKRPEPGPSFSMTTECGLCPTRFHSVTGLMQHLASVHPVTTRERLSERMPFFNRLPSMGGSNVCSLCGTKFSSAELLDWHLTVFSLTNEKCCPFFNILHELTKRFREANREDEGPRAPKRKKNWRDALVNASSMEILSEKCQPVASSSGANVDCFCEFCWYKDRIRSIIRDFNQRIMRHLEAESETDEDPDENQSEWGG